jgi:hypothetical protein
VPLLVGFPFASMIFTVAVEVDAPSAAIGLGENEQARPVAGPGLNAMVAPTPFTDGAVTSLNVSAHPFVAAVLANVNVARPALVVAVDVVTIVPDAGVRAAGHPVPVVLLVV